jgi:hypothetical protein
MTPRNPAMVALDFHFLGIGAFINMSGYCSTSLPRTRQRILGR